ncbi:hypothetical protein [Chitinophaga sp.]|uniref:hypothetical protein n=1 Tax=Chitinophaga sp. TaxID=1869181 RepID=UPI002D80F541|nr:hypothetical protein [Chitinophaga sp.]
MTGILLQSFSRGLIVMQFRARQSYIAKELCENRNKPAMHCNGKCYLKKKLDRDARQDKNTGNNKERYEVMFINDIPALFPARDADQIALNGCYKDPFTFTPSHTVFHPPCKFVG